MALNWKFPPKITKTNKQAFRKNTQEMKGHDAENTGLKIMCLH